MEFRKKTLKNGMRILVVPVSNAPSVTVMSLIEAGSKYETKDNNGISHFLEHMCFQGTERRPRGIDIAKEFDSMGAQNNAFTSHEYTGYWAKAHPKNTDKIMDIIADMYLNPTFPERELEREKGVIIEEINMYEDLPNRVALELFDNLLYGDQPAGWPIIGSRENVRSFKRDDFIDYRKKHYVSAATVLVVAGDVEPADVIKKAERLFREISTASKKRKIPVRESQKSPAVRAKFKETDQTHIVIGVRSFAISDKRHTPLKVLNTVLGGGMSSRLFQKMREQLGICYYVKSGLGEFTDHGSLIVAVGVDSSRVREGIGGILEEFSAIRDSKVPDEELRKAKDYMIGNLYLGLESSDILADFYGFQEIMKQRIKTPREIEREIESVSGEQIQKIAGDIMKNRGLNMTIVGKYNKQDEDGLRKILSV